MSWDIYYKRLDDRLTSEVGNVESQLFDVSQRIDYLESQVAELQAQLAMVMGDSDGADLS